MKKFLKEDVQRMMKLAGNSRLTESFLAEQKSFNDMSNGEITMYNFGIYRVKDLDTARSEEEVDERLKTQKEAIELAQQNKFDEAKEVLGYNRYLNLLGAIKNALSEDKISLDDLKNIPELSADQIESAKRVAKKNQEKDERAKERASKPKDMADIVYPRDSSGKLRYSQSGD